MSTREPIFTPDQQREFRTWSEKDLAHIENLFKVTRAAIDAGELRMAAQYLEAVASEARGVSARMMEGVHATDAR